MKDRLLKINEVTKILNIGRNKLYDIINSKKFIDPVSLPNCKLKLYSENEVYEWLEKQKRIKNEKNYK